MKLNEIQIIKERNSFDSIAIALLLIVVVISLVLVPGLDVGVEVVLTLVDADVDPELVVEFEVVLAVIDVDVDPELVVEFEVVLAVGDVDVDVESEEFPEEEEFVDTSGFPVISSSPAISCIKNPWTIKKRVKTVKTFMSTIRFTVSKMKGILQREKLFIDLNSLSDYLIKLNFEWVFHDILVFIISVW